jgi:hypothetical protein
VEKSRDKTYAAQCFKDAIERRGRFGVGEGQEKRRGATGAAINATEANRVGRVQ